MRTTIAVVGVVCIGLVGLAVLAQTPRSFYKPKEGLTGKVMLEVGQTGKTPGRDKWIIETDGSWTFTKRGEKEPSAKGKLTDAQMKAIAAHFSAMSFNSLPNRIGLPAEDLVSEETRYFVSLTFGTKRTVMISKDRSLADAIPKIEWEPRKIVDKGEKAKEGGKEYRERPREPSYEDWSRFVALTLVLKDAMKAPAAGK
jgi:hypothetical protein